MVEYLDGTGQSHPDEEGMIHAATLEKASGLPDYSRGASVPPTADPLDSVAVLTVALVLLAAPIVVHVDSRPGPGSPALEASAIKSLLTQLEMLEGATVVDEERGACDLACLRRIEARAGDGDALVVSIVTGLRRVRLEVERLRGSLHTVGVVDGVPGSEHWNDALRLALAPLRASRIQDMGAVRVERSAPAREHSSMGWVFGGSGVALSLASMAFAASFAADGARLNRSPIFDDQGRGADTRRQVTGPLAVGLAVAAVASLALAVLEMTEE